MGIRVKTLAVALAIPLGVGALAALSSRGSMGALEALQKPPLMPPRLKQKLLLRPKPTLKPKLRLLPRHNNRALHICVEHRYKPKRHILAN